MTVAVIRRIETPDHIISVRVEGAPIRAIKKARRAQASLLRASS